MEQIRMLNLFRCSSSENDTILKDMEYFVTDYFDGIKVESLDLKSATLAECMGIKRDANSTKKGVSHQRYCLYKHSGTKRDIFRVSLEKPLLTVIQIFINPDIYQAECFSDGSKISCESCMSRVQQCLNEKYGQDTRVDWELFRLLTAGDFAIIVRSSSLHAAYDISTLVRSVRLIVDGESIEKEAFYSYSISGIADGKIEEGEIYRNTVWTQYLEQQDKVLVRIEFSPEFRGKSEDDNTKTMKELLWQCGQRLFGRYDYQIICNPEEFQELYPYIRNHKMELTAPECPSGTHSDKVRTVLWMLHKKYISRINEKIFLKYNLDDVLEGTGSRRWPVVCRGNWKSLYERNVGKIDMLKDQIREIENSVSPFYPSAQNIKEYIRLLGRLGRILREINQLRELRISVANLLNQMEILINSFRYYLQYTKDMDEKSVADTIEEYLQNGISALQIFTRYVVNVNLQTLQTPNYDLQTNVCVEKVLIAYSQFLIPFMKEKSFPYFCSSTLYPIVVPNVGHMDMSVVALFDHSDERTDKKETEKLMVVYSPNFLSLCETCFLMPTVFHEIAHQFRYEIREQRNKCLVKCILKGFIHTIIKRILDESKQYNLHEEKIFAELVDIVYDAVSEELLLRGLNIATDRLQLLKQQMHEMLDGYINTTIKAEYFPEKLTIQYLNRTRQSIREYNENMQKAITTINENLDITKKLLGEGLLEKTILEEQFSEYEVKNYETRSKAMEKAFENLRIGVSAYADELEKQLWAEVLSLLDEIKGKLEKYGDDSGLIRKIDAFQSEPWETDEVNKEEILDSKGKAVFRVWDSVSKDLSLKNEPSVARLKASLKQYQNAVHEYIKWTGNLCEYKALSADELLYVDIHKKLSQTIYSGILEKLEEYEKNRQDKLKWTTVSISTEQIESIKTGLKTEGADQLEERIRLAFTFYKNNFAYQHVDMVIELYREVTSDLFMCSIMGLNMFGYLVVVAQNFRFRENNKYALYHRVFTVLQCLCTKDQEGNLDGDLFDQEILILLGKEIEKLYKALCEMEDEKGKIAILQTTDIDWKNPDIEKLIQFIDGVAKEQTSLNSTQKWIIRIYRQIAYLIDSVRGVQMMDQVIGEKELWKDISCSDSYYEKRMDLQKFLAKNHGEQLCRSIAQILNSPADYFLERKSLVSEEINFIFLHYEENCRFIFS